MFSTSSTMAQSQLPSFIILQEKPKVNNCQEKIYFPVGKLKPWNWKGKENNRFTSDSKPSTFKIYNAYIILVIKKMNLSKSIEECIKWLSLHNLSAVEDANK